MPFFLGVDAGGTKTHAVLVDSGGEPVAEATGGPGNPLSAGEATALLSLRTVLDGLLGGGAGAELRRAHFGVAGAGRRADVERVERMVRSLALPCSASISDDARIAFYAAAEPPGVVLVCGTGSIAVAYTADSAAYRAGGHGYLLGDEGSGYWIGREALRAALRAADGRENPTHLTEVIPKLLGFTLLEEVVSAVYEGVVGRSELASVAERVVVMGDPAARRIVSEAAGELALAARAGAREAQLEGGSVPLVLSGGLLRGNNALRRAVERRLRGGFRIRCTEAAPALGAARLARLAPLFER